MDLSIRKDVSDVSEEVPLEKNTNESEDLPSEEVTRESFPNEEEDSETAALVTADPLANLKADFEKLKADFESQKTKAEFESQLHSQQTKADFENQLGSLKADFESRKTKADFESQLSTQQTKADFESQLGSLKADFESQKADFESRLESQNAGIKSLKKFGLFSLKSSKSRLEEKGKKQLCPDTFSFLVCSKILSQPFVLGVTVFIFQITIYGLLAVDLIKQSSVNPLGIPANVETNVRVTQFLAVIVAVLTQADLRTSLEQVNEGYKQDRIGNVFGEASCGKWWFATACRFLSGALGLVITFFLIVIADNVFDLLLNFTAMEFVSQLDDVAFFLAGTGYFGSKSLEKSEEIDETSYPQAADERKRRITVHLLLLVVVSTGTLAGWGVIVRKQTSNDYLCKKYFVYSTQTELIQGGVYDLRMAERNDKRVQYMYQNRAEETESGVGFGYCDEKAVWTFYSNGNPCDYTARSAETRTFDIKTTISSLWLSGDLVQLETIYLLCFDGRVNLPTEVGNLAGLTFLDFAGNSFTGALPSELGNLSELTSLNLADNKFTGKIPSELGLLTSLTLLDLSLNKGLTGTVPPALKELTELQDFYLSGTSLTGSLSLNFCMGDIDITNFEADCLVGDEAELQCSCCTVCCGSTDEEPYSCVEIPLTKALSVLLAEGDMDERALSSPGTLQHQALRWLVYLDPANLDFELVSPQALLERFVMALLYFSTGGEKWDDSSGFLSALSVCSWHGVVCDPTAVDSNPMVVDIDFTSNNLRGQLPTELGLLSNLELFFFLKNELSGLIPTELGRLTMLDILSLAGNELTGPIPSELGGLTNVQYFDLVSNELTGLIPSELVRLTNVQFIILGNNVLTGHIPSELGILTKLIQLHLDNNELTGLIPSELGRLTRLAELYIQVNQVTGNLGPPFWCNDAFSKLKLYADCAGSAPEVVCACCYLCF